MNPPKIKIREARGCIQSVETRMPFRFGIAEMRRMPHLFLRVTLEQGGARATGLAADHLVPKWFTKNPRTTCDEDIREMREVVLEACRIAQDAAGESTPFALWWEIYHEQQRRAKTRGWPPLLASFGASLIERALLDAFCRFGETPKPLALVLRENSAGIDPGRIYPELSGIAPADILPPRPSDRVLVRHTVGLGDPLTDDDLRNGEWPAADGLPVSLRACIRHYGLGRFKIKISGDTGKNIERLAAIASLLEREAPAGYRFTLDGNESYRSIEYFIDFWNRLTRTRELEPWLDHLLFVEQPLHRDVALGTDLRKAFAGCPRVPRLVIDESDATIDTLPRALACGYEGTTHKNCKGVFKSVANLGLLTRRAARTGLPFLFSGEDLSNIGPVALLQDLCVAQNLGLTDLERNGHHYFRGLSDFPRKLRTPLLKEHSDLYQELDDGCPAVRITNGEISCASVHRRGLGTSFDLDTGQFTPLEESRPDVHVTSVKNQESGTDGAYLKNRTGGGLGREASLPFPAIFQGAFSPDPRDVRYKDAGEVATPTNVSAQP
ncbi:MAG: hypothetical protein LBK99_22865 [Opitutaceae bacterium]|jgi:hypothetical protein|nr:hypothetical protein [Opitutaceae bacterium]